MHIDSLTGKAYLHDWDRDLNHIHWAGYSYGLVKTAVMAHKIMVSHYRPPRFKRIQCKIF